MSGRELPEYSIQLFFLFPFLLLLLLLLLLLFLLLLLLLLLLVSDPLIQWILPAFISLPTYHRFTCLSHLEKTPGKDLLRSHVKEELDLFLTVP